MPLALIVSPVRSWPQDQGNRVRILALGRMLQDRGYSVHFLLSELEGGVDADTRAAMARQWQLVRSVPYRHDRQRRHAEAWGADDWYDPALDAAIEDLCAVWDYDLCLVNYAWYSRAFEALPAPVVRVLDTHDAFGDRHKRLYAAGTTPAWYFTRAEDEGRQLDRADFVIAIQDQEEAWFRGLTDRQVCTVGHVIAPAFLPPRNRSHDRTGRIRAGYMASANPSNRDSVEALIRAWAQSPFLRARAELHLAGPICRALDGIDPPFLVKHGFVPDPVDFYRAVDVAVNPNIGGSGLKIKSVEALGYGLPLYATAEGMLGICGPEAPHVSGNVAQMVRAMAADLAANPDLSAARTWARTQFLSYRSAQIAGFETLLDQATTHSRALRAAVTIDADREIRP
jgi:hypothetical protein